MDFGKLLFADAQLLHLLGGIIAGGVEGGQSARVVAFGVSRVRHEVPPCFFRKNGGPEPGGAGEAQT